MIASLDPAAAAAQTLVKSRGSRGTHASDVDVAPSDVAMIHLSPTPYFQQLHRTIFNALRGVNVWSLYTHAQADQPWKLNDQHDIRPVAFGPKTQARGKLGKILQDLATARKVIRWMKEHRIKMVVLCGYNDFIRLRIIAWCKIHSIPCYIMADSNIRGDRQRAVGIRGLVKHVLLTAIIKSCAGVMPFGSAGVEYFRKYGANLDRIFPVPPGPDYAMFRSITENDIAKIRLQYGLAQGRKRLIFVGRLASFKRVDLLVDAFVKTADQRPDWDLLIVGDGEERKNIESRIPEHLRSRVIFAGFVNDPHTLACLYRTANAMVLPSQTEAWGLVVNEAMASGLAVITSDVVGATADLVVEGYNGRTFECDKLDSLVAAVLEVTDVFNIARMQAASGAVLAAYRSHFDPVEGLRAAMRLAGLWPPKSSLVRRRASLATLDEIVAAEPESVRQVA